MHNFNAGMAISGNSSLKTGGEPIFAFKAGKYFEVVRQCDTVRQTAFGALKTATGKALSAVRHKILKKNLNQL